MNYLIYNNNADKLSIILNNNVIILKKSIKLFSVIIDINMYMYLLPTNMVTSELYYGLSILRNLIKVYLFIFYNKYSTLYYKSVLFIALI